MDTNQHIQFLIDQAEEDMGASEALAQAGFYGHALFWAHLVLEKLCKALWIRANNDVNYPHIHNLIRLLKETNIELTKEQVEFFAELNQFQAQGRYADELHFVENSVTKDICLDYIEKVKSIKKWLISLTQKI